MTRTFVARVLGVWAVFRAFSVILLTIVSHYQAPVSWTGPHPDYFSMTVLWDGFWYGQIAQYGYPPVLPLDAATGVVQQNAWAFYPAFPMMSRVLMRVTGLGFPVVGSTLALLLGFGAAVAMGLLLRDRVGAKVALAAVAVYAACPRVAVLPDRLHREPGDPAAVWLPVGREQGKLDLGSCVGAADRSVQGDGVAVDRCGAGGRVPALAAP